MYDVRGNIMSSKYKRVLLKLSGEAIAKKDSHEIFDNEKIAEIATVVKKLTDDGVQVGIVIGAGNIWRGAYGKGLKRARADQMGMLGTMINCLRMEDALEKSGCSARVMSPVGMNSFAEQYDFRKAISYLESGTVVLFGAGTGIPFVTTDTTVVVRAAEIEADVILMAKNIDGIRISVGAENVGYAKLSVRDIVGYSRDFADESLESVVADARAKRRSPDTVAGYSTYLWMAGGVLVAVATVMTVVLLSKKKDSEDED